MRAYINIVDRLFKLCKLQKKVKMMPENNFFKKICQAWEKLV